MNSVFLARWNIRGMFNRTYVPAFVALVIVVMASVYAEQQNRTIHEQNNRATVQHQAGQIRAQLEGQLNANIQLVRGLVAVLSTEPDMDQDRFSELAGRVVAGNGQIRNIAGAPDLVVSLMYPMQGNEAAIGLDYNKNDAQRAAAYQVRDSGQMVLAGPVNLVQGGRAFIARFPIFSGSGADRRFWGILSAVIDIDVLYQQTGLTNPELPIDIALAGQDGKGADGALFFGDPEIVTDTPVTMNVVHPVGTWMVFARPKGGWSATPDNLWQLRSILLVAGALIVLPTLLAGRLSAARRRAIDTLTRREHDLETLSRRLEIAVATSKIGIWEIIDGVDQMIWDPRMRELYGLQNSDRPVRLADWIHHLHPSDRMRAIRKFEHVMRDMSQYDSEYRIRLDNGDIKHIRALGSTFTDAAGRTRMIGVNWDVSQDVYLREELMRTNRTLTQRNRELNDGKRALENANAALQSQQAELQRLSLVAKHATDSIILTDADTNILWVNDAFSKVTGYSLEEAIGSTPAKLLNGGQTDPNVIEELNRRVRSGTSYHTEILNYTKSGKEIWIDTNLVPIPDDNGNVGLIIGIERDITVAKQREKELAEAKLSAEQADRAKSDFLANMSHEIRTPMNGIIGMSELLSESELSSEQQSFVDTIRGSSNALLKIINDILDLSRLDAGKLAISPVDFNLRQCIEGAVDVLRPKAREKGLTITVSHSDELPEHVHGDDGRLRQILVNLVGNAVKFTELGEIDIRVGHEAGAPYQLVIEVEDTGIGISPEQAQHIFDRFSQADAATTRKYGGTGLGLTISHVLARRMGGDITLRSELSKGCCFRLTLSLEPALEAPKPEVPETAIDTTALQDCRIVLAEDNRTNRMLINKYLDAQPVSLIEAVNGRQAVDLCRMHQPDIILMDMSMPELDGIEATAEIRSLDIVQPTILALTANAFESDRQACLDAGMDGFLSKPISKATLLQTLCLFQSQRASGGAASKVG